MTLVATADEAVVPLASQRPVLLMESSFVLMIPACLESRCASQIKPLDKQRMTQVPSNSDVPVHFARK